MQSSCGSSLVRLYHSYFLVQDYYDYDAEAEQKYKRCFCLSRGAGGGALVEAAKWKASPSEDGARLWGGSATACSSP